VNDKIYCTLCALAAIACFVVVALLWQPEQIPEEIWLQYKASHPQHNAGGITDRKNHNSDPTHTSDYWFARQLRDIAQYCNGAPESKIDEWIEKFVCDIKITDVAVAGFTGILAIFTLALAIATGVLIVVGLSQASHLKTSVDVATAAAEEAKDAIKAIQTSARAARDSADISRRILIASHRAWIHVAVNISNQPARFDKNGAGLAVSFVIKNVGTVPAINITEHAWLVWLSEGEAASAVQIQQQKCNKVRMQPFHSFGFTLFPDEISPESSGIEGVHGLFVDRKEIEKNSGRDKGVSLHVVGCVDYTFPADADNHHQTGFIYQLIKSSGPFVIGEDDGRIPPSD
jgi:hypothetical protein